MRVQCAISAAVTAVTRSVAVGAGVFAPGHVGELTQVISFDLVDAVVAETGRVQRRVRVLPSRVVVYFVLAMALFGEVSYRGVWAKLAEGLEGLAVAAPSVSALRQARRRLGPQPLRALFEMLAVPLAGPGVAGVMWRGLRPVAFDGTVMATADSAANEARFGRQGVRNGRSGYPLLRVVTLVECGTRSVLAAAFGSRDHGEVGYARTLVDQLKPAMIVLMDKMFGTNAMLAAVAREAEFLCRLKTNRNTPVCGRYRDGSFLSILGGVKVRIIEAVIVCSRADGTTIRGHYRLATTVLDHRRYPASELVDLYHQRWEIETAYLAIKHTIIGGRVLRSHHPGDVEQELWALLAVYQALRIIMTDTAAAAPGVDPDRTNFTIAFDTARDQLVRAANVLAEATLEHTKIGRNVINNLHPPRRRRQSPRAVKRPISRYAYNDLGVPKTSHTYNLDIQITQPP